MGIVYEAEEIASGRRVALKILLADLAVSEQAYERFQREARLAAAISHEHCVFVYGAHQVDGSPAIAMEIVDGETLEHKVARKEPIPIETAVRWTIDLIDGLEAAHKAGILHRDVKPSNCFVTTEGRVKVGDFGLSRTLELDVNLTQTGQFLGSPLYASPEQVRGRTLDERSDLYSCAATLYAILTGRAPYSGSNVGEVLARILSESPDAPSSIRPEIPQALDRVVLRAMERDPAKRFRDLAEFREALAPFVKKESDIAPRWRRIVAYLADATLVSLLGTGVLALQQVLGVKLLQLSSDPASTEALPSEFAIHGMSFLYFWIGEGALGTTVGKWILGLRVVSASSREKTLSGAALRSGLFLAPGLLIRLLSFAFATMPIVLALFVSLGPFVGLLLLFSTARRANAWRGIHELWSGTMVSPVPLPFRRTQLPSSPPEVDVRRSAELPDRIGDYVIDGLVGDAGGDRVIKATDTTLGRSVWIRVPPKSGELANEARRSLARPARLRWLGTVQTTDGKGDVFESPGGSSLAVFAARHPVLEWWRAHHLLTALTRELQADPNRPRGLALEQVWIDRNWNLRVLDEPIGAGPCPRGSDTVLVRETARALFQGAGPHALELPRDLPGSAEAVVRRLLGQGEAYADLEAIAKDLRRLEEVPVRLQRRTRASQLAISALAPAVLLLFTVAMTVFIAPILDLSANLESLKLDRKARDEKSIVGILTPEEREAHEIMLASSLDSPVAKPLLRQLPEQQLKLVDDIRSRHVNMTETEIAAARRLVAEDPDDPDGISPDMLMHRPFEFGLLMTAGYTGTVGFFATILAFVLRGSLSLSIFGLRVRGKRGRFAPRWLCFVRSLLAWGPVFGAAVWASWLAMHHHGTIAAVIAAVAGATWLALVVRAMSLPEQSIVDRLLGTRLVPR